MEYIGNGFSGKMLDLTTPKIVRFKKITKTEFQDAVDNKMSYSIIGHTDLAKYLGIPLNRASITLTADDTLYLVMVEASRLPEGKCELHPEHFTYAKVEVAP